MYDSIRRERQYRMQTLSGQIPSNNLSNQSHAIAVIAIILFALAGLLSGFAVGAFLRPAQQLQANNAGTTLTPPTQSKGNTSNGTTHTQHPVKLGYPVIEQASSIQKADNNTIYTFSAYAVDQSIDAGHGNAIYAANITCKLWLVQRIPANGRFVIARKDIQNVNALQNPIVGTVQNTPFAEIPGLNFAHGTAQTQLCNAEGKTLWKYQVSSAVAPGDYDLVVLTDWEGKYYNWSWRDLTITH